MCFHSSWVEVEPEEAKKYWNDVPVHAYDEKLQVSEQLNITKGACKCKIDDAVKEGKIIFIQRN